MANNKIKKTQKYWGFVVIDSQFLSKSVTSTGFKPVTS